MPTGKDFFISVAIFTQVSLAPLMQNIDLTEKSGTLLGIKNLLSYIKMGKAILMFGNIEIEKNKLYPNNISTLLGDVDNKKVLISTKISFGEKNYKYFIGYFF